MKEGITGYPKTVSGHQVVLTDFNGKEIAKGRVLRCTRVRGHERGGWISNERCSYQFVKDGVYYAGRGRGDGISVNARRMKTKPRWRP